MDIVIRLQTRPFDKVVLEFKSNYLMSLNLSYEIHSER